MKKILTAALLGLSLNSFADNAPLWLRFSAISPDGQTIAFSYKGDIFSVPVNGGTAKQLTTNSAYDAYPVWSPDGQKIAFASTREGSMDVYLMDKNGGLPKRLTTNSGNETPMAFTDNSHVLFTSAGMPTAKSIFFASGTFPQTYEVGIDASRPRLYSPMTMYDVSIRSNGDILYHDAKGDVRGVVKDGLVAFRLSDLPDTHGQTVDLTLKWQSFSGPKSVKFKYKSRQ